MRGRAVTAWPLFGSRPNPRSPVMVLTKNVCIGGVWYGPAHGNAEMADDEYAELLARANGGGSAAYQFRERLVAAMARLVDAELMPKMSELSDVERAEAFAMSEDDIVARMLEG